MKKIITLFSVIAAAILSFSCAKNAVEEPNIAPEGFITVSCTLSNADTPDSKVTLTNDGTSGKTRWVDGDKVFFHGAYVGTSGDDKYSYVAAAHDVSADGKTAQFTIPEIAKRFNNSEISWRNTKYVTDLYAVYPASAVADFSDGDDWYFVSAFKSTNHLLLAGCNDTRVNDGLTFTFINLTGALSFKVDGDFDSYSISGNNDETVGYTNYCVKMDRNSDAGTNDFRTLYVGSDGPGPSSGAQTSIVVNDWDGADGTTINTVYFPNGVNFTGGFTIKFFKSGSEVKRVSTKTPKNIAVGKYLDLGDIDDYLSDPPASHPLPAGWSDIDDIDDLSEDGSANCYVVYTANHEYKFPLVRGNSTASVGKVGGTKVVWETKNTDVAPSTGEIIADVDYYYEPGEDSYMVIKTPATLTHGNALVAALAEDGTTILWSWHIWIPSSTLTNNQYGLGGQKWMDRNLGALVVAEASESVDVDPLSFGFFYAWGRKDPFPTPSSVGGSTPIKTTGTFNLSGSLMSMEESYASPTTFVATGADSSWPWDTDGSSVRKYYWKSSKTINDPCPPGYIVPTFSSDAGTLWKGLHSDSDNAANFTINATHKWFKAGTDPYIVFPIVGFLDGCTSKPYIRTDRSNLWSAPYSDSDGLAKVLRVNTGGTTKNESERFARGFSVRCVVDE